MDERTLRVLEYDKILQLLEDCAACSLGKERARRLQPETRPEVVCQRLAETSQAAAIIGRYGSPPLGGLSDVSEALARARVQAQLSGPELLAISQMIGCARRLREYFTSGADLAPDLADLARRLSDQSDLQAEIERCLDDEGLVRRTASERLDRLYGRQAVLEGRTRERLESILRQAAGRELLQEPVIVQRAGRFCLPLKADRQGQLRGVVHDRSASGATVFVEPLELVQSGNELRQVELEMEEERRAILRALTRQTEAVNTDLTRDLAQLATLDYVTARGKLARRMGGLAPGVRHDGVVVLRGARHPLLGPECVANDIWLGEDFDTLLITGPNTGGKTVALKTMGLLVLMAQSGLHVPTEPGSEISVFNQVWADIGDEQSIEQSLSTFSSHMTQIIRLVSRADAWQRREGERGRQLKALVLLDELGAGTDPAEGAALGQAILEELHATGCRTIATTHIPQPQLLPSHPCIQPHPTSPGVIMYPEGQLAARHAAWLTAG
jgi:DNA mismatch repair protein MutS2